MKELKILKCSRVISYVWAVAAVILTCLDIGTWQWTACNLYLLGIGLFITETTIRDHKRKVGRFVRHYNSWWWGRSVTIIAYNGSGMVELGMDDKYEGWGFINSLMVEPRERRCGLGTALLLECERIGRECGLSRFYLTVRKDCQWRIDWYKKMGYELDYEDWGEGSEYEYRMYKTIEK